MPLHPSIAPPIASPILGSKPKSIVHVGLSMTPSRLMNSCTRICPISCSFRQLPVSRYFDVRPIGNSSDSASDLHTDHGTAQFRGQAARPAPGIPPSPKSAGRPHLVIAAHSGFGDRLRDTWRIKELGSPHL